MTQSRGPGGPRRAGTPSSIRSTSRSADRPATGPTTRAAASTPSAAPFSDLRKITAIFRSGRLAEVEAAVLALRVPGISVTRVKGFGEYRNLFAKDLLDEHVRVEIFIARDLAGPVVRAIVDAAHTGMEGDGIVAVLPVEALYHIRNKDVGLTNPPARHGSSPSDARTGGRRR